MQLYADGSVKYHGVLCRVKDIINEAEIKIWTRIHCVQLVYQIPLL